MTGEAPAGGTTRRVTGASEGDSGLPDCAHAASSPRFFIQWAREHVELRTLARFRLRLDALEVLLTPSCCSLTTIGRQAGRKVKREGGRAQHRLESRGLCKRTPRVCMGLGLCIGSCHHPARPPSLRQSLRERSRAKRPQELSEATVMLEFQLLFRPVPLCVAHCLPATALRRHPAKPPVDVWRRRWLVAAR